MPNAYVNPTLLARGLATRRQAFNTGQTQGLAQGAPVGNQVSVQAPDYSAQLAQALASGLSAQDAVRQISDLDFQAMSQESLGQILGSQAPPWLSGDNPDMGLNLSTFGAIAGQYQHPADLYYRGADLYSDHPSDARNILSGLTQAPAAPGGAASGLLAAGLNVPPADARPELTVPGAPTATVPAGAGTTNAAGLLPGGTAAALTPSQIALAGQGDRTGESPLARAWETGMTNLLANPPMAPNIPLPTTSPDVTAANQAARDTLMGFSQGEGRGLVAEAARLAQQRMREGTGLTADQQARQAERVLRPYQQQTEQAQEALRNAAIAAGTWRGTGTVPGTVRLQAELARTTGDVLTNLEIEQQTLNEQTMQARIAQASGLGISLQGVEAQQASQMMDFARMSSDQQNEQQTQTLAVYGLREQIRAAMAGEDTARYQIAGQFLTGVFDRDLETQVTNATLTLDVARLAEDSRQFDNELLFRAYALQSGYEEAAIRQAWEVREAALNRVMTATEAGIDRQLTLMVNQAEITLAEAQLAEQARQFDNEIDFRIAAAAAGFADTDAQRAWQASQSALDRTLTEQTEAERIAVQREGLLAETSAADLDRELTREVEEGRLSLGERQLAEQASEYRSQLDFNTWATSEGWGQDAIDRAWRASESALGRAHELTVQGGALEVERERLLATVRAGDLDRALQEQIASGQLTLGEQELAQRSTEFTSQQEFQTWALEQGWEQDEITRAWQAGESALDRAQELTLQAGELEVERERLAATVRAGDLDRALNEAVQMGTLELNERELAQRATEFTSQQEFQTWALEQGWAQDEIARSWQASESALDRANELTLQQRDHEQRVLDRELQAQVQLGTLDLQTQQLAQDAAQFDSRLAWDQEAFARGLDEAAADRGWREAQAALDRGLRRDELLQIMTEAEADRQLQRETFASDLALRTFMANVDAEIQRGTLTLDEARLAEQAHQFESNQDFQEWAIERGILADEANRAWQTSERVATQQFQADQAILDRSLQTDIEQGRLDQADRELAEGAREFDTRQEFEESQAVQDALDAELDRQLTRDVEEGRISQADRVLAEQSSQFTTRETFDRWAVQQNLDAATAERVWQTNERVQTQGWTAVQDSIGRAWEANQRGLDRTHEANLATERNQLEQQGQALQLQIATMQITSAADMQRSMQDFQANQAGLDRNLEGERMALQERLQNAGYTQEQALQASQQTWQSMENSATRGANWTESEAAREAERQLMEAGFTHADAALLVQQTWQAQQNALQNQYGLDVAQAQFTYQQALQASGQTFQDAQNRAAEAHNVNMQALQTRDTTVIMARQNEYARELEELGFTHQDAILESQQVFAREQAELDRRHENDLEASRQMMQLSQASLDRQLQADIEAGRISQADRVLVEQAGQFLASMTSTETQAQLDRDLTREVEAGRLSSADRDRIESARQADARTGFDTWATVQGFSEAQRNRAWEASQASAQRAWQSTESAATRAQQDRQWTEEQGLQSRQVAIAESAQTDQHNALFGFRNQQTGQWVPGQMENAALSADQIRQSIRIANDQMYGYMNDRTGEFVPGSLQLTADQFDLARDRAETDRTAIQRESARADAQLFGTLNPATGRYEGGQLGFTTAQTADLISRTGLTAAQIDGIRAQSRLTDAQVAEVRASTAMSTERLNQLVAETRLTRAQIEQVQAATAMSTAQLDQLAAETGLTRAQIEQVRASTAVATAQVDQLIAETGLTEEQIEQVRANTGLTTAQTGAVQSQINVNNAQIANMDAERQRLFDALYGYTDDNDVFHMGSLAMQAGNLQNEANLVRQTQDAFYGYRDQTTGTWVRGRANLDEQQGEIAAQAAQRATDEFYGFDSGGIHILGIAELNQQANQRGEDLLRGFQVTQADGTEVWVQGQAERDQAGQYGYNGVDAEGNAVWVPGTQALQAQQTSANVAQVLGGVDANGVFRPGSLQLNEQEYDLVVMQYFGGIGPDGNYAPGTADVTQMNMYLGILAIPGVADDPTMSGVKETALMGLMSQAGLDAEILTQEEVDAQIADATVTELNLAQGLHSSRATRDTFAVGSDEWWNEEAAVWSIETRLGFTHDVDPNTLDVGFEEDRVVLTNPDSIREMYRRIARVNGWDTDEWDREIAARHPEWYEVAGAPTIDVVIRAAETDAYLQAGRPPPAEGQGVGEGTEEDEPAIQGRYDGERVAGWEWDEQSQTWHAW